MDLQLRNILSIPYVGEWLEALSQSYFSITGISNIQYIVFGSILVLIMLFEPLGIFGIWIRTKKYWKTWPFGFWCSVSAVVNKILGPIPT
jgi:branched-chain amino acid transport system permease protein